MKIRFILPSLQEAKSPDWRPIKYSLFPPLGLATLAAFCHDDDQITITDEHVEVATYDDEPDLVCIETYITNAYRAYTIADAYRKRGVYVAMGGLHATTLPHEAKDHADTVLLGIGEDSFPRFLRDLRRKDPQPFYERGEVDLTLLPMPRRDLFQKHAYLVPNSMVFTRGCPNRCSFCYVSSFFRGGKSFYALTLDRILKEIDSLHGRHLYFLDDNLFADKRLSRELFREMRGIGKLFQGAITVRGVLEDDLIEEAYEAGFRSAFIGFESTNTANLKQTNKLSNIGQDYRAAIQRLDRLGVMINGSFIFGLDEDTPQTFAETTRWAIDSGITTATFHLLTPYPGTVLYEQMTSQNRIDHWNWSDYDTRHLVFRHPVLSKDEAERLYREAYREFYRWRNIVTASSSHERLRMKLKHFIYAGAWKRFEPVWNLIVKEKLFTPARRLLEMTLK